MLSRVLLCLLGRTGHELIDPQRQLSRRLLLATLGLSGALEPQGLPRVVSAVSPFKWPATRIQGYSKL